MARQMTVIVAGVVAGAALASGAVVYFSQVGVQRHDASDAKDGKESGPVTLNIKEGTLVPFTLLEPMSSGGSEAGDVVTAVVNQDVYDASGKLSVPAGSVAKLEVVRSREASAITSLVNQPARLEVRFLAMSIVGKPVKLTAKKGEPDATLELTRGISSRSGSSAALKALYENPETKRFLDDLADRMNGENLGEEFDDPDSVRIMAQVAAELELEATKRAGSSGKSIGTILAATHRISKGSFDKIGASDALLAIQVVSELGRVANGVDKGLRGAIKGRNINVPIGTRLTAYVAKDATITK